MQSIREVKVPVPFCELGWRTVGCRLDDAMQGSDQEVYYSMLCEVIRRCEEDKERIKPTVNTVESEATLIPVNENPPPCNGVADMTHRGAGL